MRPHAPSLRSFADPEGEFLTYAQVRASVHPIPAEQHVVAPKHVTIIDPERESFLRVENGCGL